MNILQQILESQINAALATVSPSPNFVKNISVNIRQMTSLTRKALTQKLVKATKLDSFLIKGEGSIFSNSVYIA